VRRAEPRKLPRAVRSARHPKGARLPRKADAPPGGRRHAARMISQNDPSPDGAPTPRSAPEPPDTGPHPAAPARPARPPPPRKACAGQVYCTPVPARGISRYS